MTVQGRCRRWGALVLLLFAVAACGAEAPATFTSVPFPTQPTVPGDPTATATPIESSPTAMVVESPTETPAVPTGTPTPPSNPTSWFASGVLALFTSGDGERSDLYALTTDGDLQEALPDVGSEVSVSPDGRWLGFVRWHDDGRADLVVQDAATGEQRLLSPETASGLLRFAFHPDGQRLVYLDLGAYTDVGVPWALVLADLVGVDGVRYEALMADGETRPLPGAPVGWSGQELIIDTFLPYTEGGSMGVWAVTLPAEVPATRDDGGSEPLEELPLRELIPGSPVYSSRVFLSPDRGSIAYLGRDPAYAPSNYQPEFYDLAVNRLGVAEVANGERRALVEVDDGSALARALAWSPDGDRLLFAQGFYEGQSFESLSLKSSSRDGTVVQYGPLTLPPLGGLLELAWCNPSLALYVTWDGGGGMEHLLSFDLNTGESRPIASERRLHIVGCAP
jgi:hypothetical protein